MTEPIKIFRGDDTDFIGNKVIEITLDTDIDLSGITADFLLCGFKQHFDSVAVATKRLEVVISHEETKRFPLGRQLGTLVLKSADGKIKHVDTQIEFFVTNKTGFPMFCGDEQIKTRFGLKIKWDDIRDTPTTLKGYGIEDAASSEALSEVAGAVSELDRSVVKTVNGQKPDENGNVVVETGGGGTTDYNDLGNKPSINGTTLSGNKTAEQLGLATSAQGAKADTALQADSPGLLYAMGAVVDASEITPSTDPSTGREYIAVSLSDRTINRIKVGNDDTADLRLALPPAQDGKSRDFYVSLRGFIAGGLAPLAVTVTGATLHDVAGGAFAIELPMSTGDYERTYHLTEIDTATTAPSSDPVFLVAIDIPRELSDAAPEMSGGVAPGMSENASRGDHVHPAETAGSARYAEIGELGAFIPDDFFPVRATIPGIAVTEFTAANTEFLIEWGATKAFVLIYEHDGVFLSIAKFNYVTGAYISPGADVSGVPTFNGITPSPGGFPMVLKSARNAEPVAVRGVKVAPLTSPAFTGTPTAPTPAANDNSTKVATTAFVKTAISGISVMPLSGRNFDFATTQGVMDALKATIEALGGTVVNAPTAQTQQTQGE